MKPDDGANRLTETDPYATRTPSPDSLEALAVARVTAAEATSRARGVGRDEFDRSLLECGFVDAEGLLQALDRLAAEGQTADTEALARALVQLGRLTRYQASALFQGKGRSLLIGPYVVLDKLGSGGMGLVFKARLRGGGPEVALKLLPPSASRHPKSVLRFRREAEIMEKLNHPNIVASHEIGHYNGVHYLVMDYVEGADLDRIVRSSGPMKLPRAVDCIIQAARGLAAAHERGIVHRDIKPANLIVGPDGVVRVLDLGLARITQGDQSLKDATSAPSLTASGIIMGTVDFLPPEQSDDPKRVDHRADIYALGCTLYYLLTARPPFSGDSIMQRLLAHHQKPIPGLTEARPDVPVEVDSLYRRMMAKSPDDRPQTIAEVAETLVAWRNRSGGGRSLRVFNDGGASKAGNLASKVESANRKAPESLETYDLMTFVSDQLFEPDTGLATVRDPVPIPPRPTRKARKQSGTIDLVVRVLVAAAALAVLVRFFPIELFRSKTVTPPPAPAIVVEPPPAPLPEPPVARPIVAESSKPQAIPIPHAETAKAPTQGVAPADPGPPPGPSLLEELMRPPPPAGPGGQPPRPPPRDGPAPKKKGQGPPRKPGSP